MSGRWRAWARLPPPYTTYEISQPWMLYTYRIPDRIAWLLGFSLILVECLICGQRHRVWFRTWGAKPDALRPRRQALLDRHRHRPLAWKPHYWHRPMANYEGWRRWREQQWLRN